jgi:hypothetical protein
VLGVSEHRSSSKVQQEAEEVILRLTEKKLGLFDGELQPQRVLVKNALVNLDGYSEKEGILCEVYARIGKLKSAQKHKVTNDIMKMLLVDKVLGVKHKKVIAICDEEIEQNLRGKGWNSLAIEEYGIEIIRVEIVSELTDNILQVQKRQYR